MAKQRKRPIYRQSSERHFKIYPDGTYISVHNDSLFFKAEIIKGSLENLSEDMTHCLKKEFIKRYRQARKAIRL